MATETSSKTKELKITLVRGRAKASKKQSLILDALGIKKTASVVFHDNSPTIKGMLAKVAHLVKIEDNK
jgi:large subunit ribosomal protein L30